MHSLSSIEKILLNNNLEQLQEIQSKGFPTQDVIELVHDWPRVPFEFKLHTVADAILTHYKNKPEFGKELSEMIGVLKKTNKDTASYRLGKIIDSWIHQQWTSLPCALLSPIDAYNLFPKHALAPPPIPIPQKPFRVKFELQMGYGEKTLKRPLEWEGALDAFSSLLNCIPQPKNMSVIGFGDGKELVVLNRKWPTTTIHGFEQTLYTLYCSPDLTSITNNTVIHYTSSPNTYQHKDQPVELILIRHPNSKDPEWNSIILKALNSLSCNGTLLMTFYSEGEMRVLKEEFNTEAYPDFIWNDAVNPFAYNPSFMSTSGSYSFDLFLVSIRRKDGNQNDFLEVLTPTKTRGFEESPLTALSHRKKFVIMQDDIPITLSQSNFYEEKCRQSQSCFKCQKVVTDYFYVHCVVGGKKPIIANIPFCIEHVPSTKKHLEIVLREPWSSWRNKYLHIPKYNLASQIIAISNGL